MRNVFKEVGFTEEEIERKLREVEYSFFEDPEDRLFFPVGEDMAYIEDTGNNDARTEGMSYGMMMCVQLDRQADFDRLWKWSKTYMFQTDGEFKDYFAWSCKTTGEKNAEGPAPDGEEYYAMALFFADRRWGSREGIFDYAKEARAILSAALHKGEPDRPGAPMWNRENGQILFVPGSPFTDPSYHLAHFYEQFALYADEADRPFWKFAAGKSREFLVTACHPETGMNPEYSTFEGKPFVRPGSRWRHDWFYSDAYRTSANLGMDALWYGIDFGQYQAAGKLAKFLLPHDFGRETVFEIDGTPVDEPVKHPLGVLAATAEGALCAKDLSQKDLSPEDQALRAFVVKLFSEPMRRGKMRYYDNCLALFAHLALSGRYRIF